MESPCPSDPDEHSTPGNFSQCGCPWNGDESLRSSAVSFFSQKPANASPMYSAGALCPPDQMMRSRSSHVGFFGSWLATFRYKAATISIIESVPPACPEPAQH